MTKPSIFIEDTLSSLKFREMPDQGAEGARFRSLVLPIEATVASFGGVIRLPQLALGFQARENGGKVGACSLGGAQTRNPETVLGNTKAATNGPKRMEPRGGPVHPRGGQIPKPNGGLNLGY